MSPRVRVRAFTSADAQAVARVSVLNGQPDTDSGADPSYLAFLAETGTVVVAVSAPDEVIAWGAVTATGWGEMLTDLFVHPGWHGRGVGTCVLGHFWPSGSDKQPRFTFSSRHANALPLYARAGLNPSWPLLYLSGNPNKLTATAAEVVTQTPAGAGAAEKIITLSLIHI